MNNTIPIQSQPNQTFTVTVEVNGINSTYLINCVYRDKLGYWTMDISDFNTNAMLLSNVPLLSFGNADGNADIFRQMAYMQIGSLFVIKTVNTTEDSPSYNTISTDYSIVWGDN
jgi:hypothetical protein